MLQVKMLAEMKIVKIVSTKSNKYKLCKIDVEFKREPDRTRWINLFYEHEDEIVCSAAYVRRQQIETRYNIKVSPAGQPGRSPISYSAVWKLKRLYSRGYCHNGFMMARSRTDSPCTWTRYYSDTLHEMTHNDFPMRQAWNTPYSSVKSLFHTRQATPDLVSYRYRYRRKLRIIVGQLSEISALFPIFVTGRRNFPDFTDWQFTRACRWIALGRSHGCCPGPFDLMILCDETR